MQNLFQATEEKFNKIPKNPRASTAATAFRTTRSSIGFRKSGFSPKSPFGNFVKQKFSFMTPATKNSKKMFMEIRESLKRNEKDEWMKFSGFFFFFYFIK